MPSVNVVNGKQIVVEDLGAAERAARFLAKPFAQMWRHQDLIQAILRREVSEPSRDVGGLGLGRRGAAAGDRGLYLRLHHQPEAADGRQPMGPRIGYALFIFSGIIVFNFWSEMAFRAPKFLHKYVHFIEQRIFPSDMLAVISTLRAALYTLISIAVMLLFQLLMVGSLPWTVLLIPFTFIPFMAFLIGMSWFLCAIGAFTRDAGYLMINIVPLFLFATPVFYPHTALPAPWDFWTYANALTGYVEVMRDIVLLGKLPNLPVYLWTLLTSVFTFYFGYWFFDRYRNVIVDVI